MSLLPRMINLYAHLQQVLTDPRRKGIGQIARELADVARRTRSSPEWYFINFAYRRNAGDYTHYLYRKQSDALTQKLRQRKNFDILYDKLKFHNHFEGSNLRLPRMLAYNLDTTFHVDGMERHVDDAAAFVALVNELLARSSSGSIFAKPAASGSGHGCRRIDTAGSNLAELHARLVARQYLFEETLVQHPALSAIYPRSINTVRVLTCKEPDEPPAVVAAVLRLGAGGSAVDNASQGGIFVGLELSTGRLFPQARQFFKHGGQVYATHPDTGFRFEGTQVPLFSEVLATARSAAAQAPQGLDLIGWDIAVTETGPVIIEGNAPAHLPLMEIALGKGMLVYPPFRKLCQRILNET